MKTSFLNQTGLIALCLFLASFTVTSEPENHKEISADKLSENSIEKDLYQSTCYKSNNFTVRLRTLGTNPLFITKSQAQPNTSYDLVITFTGTYVPFTNVAYCLEGMFGFTSNAPNKDSSQGNATFRIKTLPFGSIIAVVGPTDGCTGVCNVSDAFYKELL